MSLKTTKVSMNRVINIILTIILIAIIIFGWLYIKGLNPIDIFSDNSFFNGIHPKYLFTIYGSSNLRFNRPSYTVVDQKLIYVADTNNSRIAIFNYNGKFIMDFGEKGLGRLFSPVSMVIFGDKIYVADTGTSKIHIFDKKGNFERFFPVKANIVPQSIFINNNRLYILDAKEMRLFIVDFAGNVLKVIGKRGVNPGEFYFPYSVYVNNKGLIYIADSNNNRIQIFDKNGKLLGLLTGSDEEMQGVFSVPRGTAFDKAGNLYTTEGLINSVTVLNVNGTVIKRFDNAEPTNSEIGMPDTMQLPTSVFIDDNQRLYVTEFGKSRVLVYSLD